MNRQVNITAGPDKFRLMVALFHGTAMEQEPVSFTLQENDHSWKEDIKIYSAQREDGSGDCWNLTGRNMANNCQVKIFFCLKRRQGQMIFVQK